MIYKVHDGQTIFDLCLQFGGTIENVYGFISEQGIRNINDLPPAQVEVDESVDINVLFVKKNRIVFNTTAPKIQNVSTSVRPFAYKYTADQPSVVKPLPINYYKIHDGQTIYDLALQFYGDIEKVFTIISTNPSVSNLNFNIFNAGSIIVTNDSTPALDFIKKNRIVINTGASTAETDGGGSFDDSFDDSFDNGN